MNMLLANGKYVNFICRFLGFSFVLFLIISYVSQIYFNKNLQIGELPSLFASDFSFPYYFGKTGVDYNQLHDVLYQFLIARTSFDENSIHNFIASTPFPYPPFAVFLIMATSLIPHTLSLIVFYLSFLSTLYCTTFSFIKRNEFGLYSKISISLLLSFGSFPVLYVLDRGNWDMIVFVLILSSLFLYYKNNDVKFFTYAIAIATAIKIFPVIFTVILLRDKKYKNFIICGIASLSITILSFFFFKNNFLFNIKSLANEIGAINFLAGNVNFALIFKDIIKVLFSNEFLLNHTKAIINTYSIIMIALFGLICSVVIWSKKIKRIDIITLLSIFAMLSPHMSCGYKLLLGLIPIYFALFEDSSKTQTMILFFQLFALSLIPLMMSVKFGVWLRWSIPVYTFSAIFACVFIKNLRMFYYEVRSK